MRVRFCWLFSPRSGSVSLNSEAAVFRRRERASRSASPRWSPLIFLPLDSRASQRACPKRPACDFGRGRRRACPRREKESRRTRRGRAFDRPASPLSVAVFSSRDQLRSSHVAGVRTLFREISPRYLLTLDARSAAF